MDHLDDLRETFETLRTYQMRLNPKKCIFGVTSGKFLGFLIDERGIEANPDKVQAVITMTSPKTVKDVQRLTGCLAALGRFLSRAGDKCHYFFSTIKKGTQFEWTSQAEAAFLRLKEHLHTLPRLVGPLSGEVLCLYLAISDYALSAVLLTERDGMQLPVYFVSHMLQNAELKYPTVKKFGFALFLASKKLRPYFLAHRLIVYTDQPLKQPFTNLEASGRMLNWAIELNAFDISYEPRKAIKGQAFADFIVEMTRPPYFKNEKAQWVVHVDGSATQNGCGAGIICESPEGDIYEYAMRFNFQASNNEAEYEALICGIQMSKAAGAAEVLILSNSQLIVSQVKGEYEAKDDAMIKYLEKVHQEVQQLTSFEIQHIPRSENNKADALSKLASSASCDTPRHVFWEAKRLQKKCTWFEIWNGTLYKKAFSRPLLRCVTPEKGHEVLEDVHQGLCSSHIGGRALAEKALRIGYYWPTLKEDALDLVKRCDKCQRFAHLIRRPAQRLTPITSPIPFAKWGIDLLGPYTTAPGGLRYVIVAVDYFTKWVEAEDLKNTKAQDVRAFIWKNIITRFGVPQSIAFDNGPQFKTLKLEGWLADHGIIACFASQKVYGPTSYPMSYGLYGPRPKNSTGETPFLLAYGAEAVLPIEMCEPTLRVMLFDEDANWEMMKAALDVLPETRGNAALRQQLYKLRMTREYNKRFSRRILKVGDFVLRKMEAVGRANEQGKLTPTREGPYEIYEEVRDGTYRIQDMQGRPILRTWNADNLKKYFF
ncbi:uncharacterized protein [Spinacia oleracea]|uniref:Uncharacterized protein n=1 Tax=Spinacia oleracea TaxID=3562 RepID=A0ABM3QYA3_SPIOL|nr:uncharacterized protein LOC130463279 [Spinacia oleracea]